MPDLWMDVDTALAEVPVNLFPLLDDTDFKTRETAIAYNASGMDLTWNFVTTAGAQSQTAVTPTTGGTYDWAHQGDGLYSIEIPASGGASINNDTEGFGWFSGVCSGVLPWRGPVIGFRAAALNNALIDDAWSATRGLSGTALPNAAANAAGGLPVSGGGGLVLDTLLSRLDATVSSRSTYAGGDTSGTTTLVSLLTSTRAGYLDNLDGHTAQTGDSYPIVSSGTHGNAALKALIDTIDTVVDAVKAITDNLPNSGALSDLATLATRLSSARAGYLDKLNVAGTLAHSGDADTYKADVSGLATSSALGTVDSVADAIKAVTDLLPDAGALSSLATASALATVDSVADAIKAKTDALPSDPADASVVAGLIAAVETKVDTLDGVADAIKLTTDKIDDTLEDDGGTYRFTADALTEAPTGGGGGGDDAATIYDYFTDDDRADAFKASVSGLSTFDPTASKVDVGAVNGTPVSSVGDFKATGFSTHSAADVNAAITSAHGSGSYLTATGFATPTNLTDARDSILAKLLRYFRLALRKDSAIAADHATELGEINANVASGAGSYDNASDAQQAIRDTPPLGTEMRGTDDALLATNYTAPDNDGIGEAKTAAEGAKAAAEAAQAAAEGITIPTPPTVEEIAAEIEREDGPLDELADKTTDLHATLDEPGVFSAEALANAPTGGGGGGDATAANQTLILAAIGTPVVDLATDLAAVKSQTAAIEADTQDLQTQVGTDGSGLTAVPWNAAWDAEVQSECADALAAYDPPTKAELDSGLADLPTTAEFEARTKPTADYFDPAADRVKLHATQGDYAPAVAGDAMDFVDAPNVTAVAAIQAGLSTLDSTGAEAAAAAALTAFGPPTRTEATADKQAILDRGNAAWATATGFATPGDIPTPPTKEQIAAEIEREGGPLDDLHATLEGPGVFSEEALANAPTGGGSGGSDLSGPYVLTITVTNALTGLAIEGARARVWLNSDDESRDTDVNGQYKPALTDGTWSVAVRRWGFDSVVTTKVINGANATLDIELTPWTIPVPESPDKATGVYLCLDEYGNPAAGVEVSLRLIAFPDGDAGYIYLGSAWIETTDESGIATFGPNDDDLDRGLLKGRTYEASAGGCRSWTFVVPDGSTFEIPSIIDEPPETDDP